MHRVIDIQGATNTVKPIDRGPAKRVPRVILDHV